VHKQKNKPNIQQNTTRTFIHFMSQISQHMTTPQTNTNK